MSMDTDLGLGRLGVTMRNTLIPCNEISKSNILEQLRHGFARFELVSSPTTCVSDSVSPSSFAPSFLGVTQGNGSLFFAAATSRSSSSRSHSSSPEAKKIEQNTVDLIKDSPSLFEALGKGIGSNKGRTLTADDLRMNVKKAICNDRKAKEKYKEAISSINEKTLNQYCERIGGNDSLGVKSELLVLSKLYKLPITVYVFDHENESDRLPFAEYDAVPEGLIETVKNITIKEKKVVRLLYSVASKHYYLLP